MVIILTHTKKKPSPTPVKLLTSETAFFPSVFASPQSSSIISSPVSSVVTEPNSICVACSLRCRTRRL
jgi:hypothetical protein